MSRTWTPGPDWNPQQPTEPTLAEGLSRPKPRRRWPLATAVGVVAFIVGAVAGSAGGEQTATTATPSPTVTATVTTAAEPGPAVTVTAKAPAAAPKPAPVAVTIPGDGTFEVPGDMKPGKYRSAKPASGNCYWARLRTLDTSDLEAIIANGNSAGPTVVTVKRTDKVFETAGCEEWRKVG